MVMTPTRLQGPTEDDRSLIDCHIKIEPSYSNPMEPPKQALNS